MTDYYAGGFDTSTRYQFSSMLVNGWNWRTAKLRDCQALRLATRNMILTEFADLEVKEILAKRTAAEWRWLYIKRSLLITFNVIFLLGSAFIIFLTTTNAPSITAWAKRKFAEWEWMPESASEYASLAPNLALTALNALVNPVSAQCVAREAWDYTSTVTGQLVWRFWFGRVVNFMIIVVVQFQIATDTQIFPRDSAFVAAYPFESGPDGDNIAWNQIEDPAGRYDCR